ncbi:MAG TPA: YdeI/OmpD-associated family protein [Chitinophagaceae bacterium]|nr:YdeI/OmpD-associated family protein [Chitinophagaceae bacterium]
MKSFSTKILKIGINPYVSVPAPILKSLFVAAGKDKSPIKVCIRIKDRNFQQHLLRYKGEWRLFLNTPMRVIAGKDVGETIRLSIEYDPAERKTPVHPGFKTALSKNKKAAKIFADLTPSLQKEILRYINSLKSEEAVQRNIKKAINFLLGKEGFPGVNRQSRA